MSNFIGCNYSSMFNSTTIEVTAWTSKYIPLFYRYICPYHPKPATNMSIPLQWILPTTCEVEHTSQWQIIHEAKLFHSGPVAHHMATQIWVNIGSDNGIFLTAPSHYLNQYRLNHQWGPLAFIHLKTISQEMLKISILDMSLKITDLRFQPHLTGTNDLKIPYLPI